MFAPLSSASFVVFVWSPFGLGYRRVYLVFSPRSNSYCCSAILTDSQVYSKAKVMMALRPVVAAYIYPDAPRASLLYELLGTLTEAQAPMLENYLQAFDCWITGNSSRGLSLLEGSCQWSEAPSSAVPLSSRGPPSVDLPFPMCKFPMKVKKPSSLLRPFNDRY